MRIRHTGRCADPATVASPTRVHAVDRSLWLMRLDSPALARSWKEASTRHGRPSPVRSVRAAWRVPAKASGARAARRPPPTLQPSDRRGVCDLDSSVHRLPSQDAPGANGRIRSQFLTWLAVDRQVSASTQNQALSALLFLYKEVLTIEIGQVPPVVRAGTPDRLPVVLSREEIGAILKKLAGTERLIVILLYGRGSDSRSVSSFASKTSISIVTRSSCGKEGAKGWGDDAALGCEGGADGAFGRRAPAP